MLSARDTIIGQRIEMLPRKQFVGKRAAMSYAGDKTRELWSGFMPEHGRISDRVGKELYSIQRYPPGFFGHFDKDKTFDKWAAVEVDKTAHQPEGMETLSLEGLYAVFNYRGSQDLAPQTFLYLFTVWLPQSGYELDDRPHFEVLGEKFRLNHPESEEEIWIPVVAK